MIVSIDEAMSLPAFKGQEEQTVQDKLDALEQLVRKHTNNNFQNRHVRFTAATEGQTIHAAHPFLRVGDTVQVTESGVNDGLYVVQDITDNETIIDGGLFPVEHNLITKVEYPADVKAGVLNLLNWEAAMRDKVGIASETISRHSVTYFAQDAANQVDGYPAALMGFLRPYMKARF